MSNLRWERDDGGRVWTLIGRVPWRGVSGRTYLSSQQVGYVYYTQDGWGVCHSGMYVTTLDNLDEAKALLQTIVGASNV